MPTLVVTVSELSNTFAVLTWDNASTPATVHRNGRLVSSNAFPPFRDSRLYPNTPYTWDIATTTDSGTVSGTTESLVTTIYLADESGWMTTTENVFGSEAYVVYQDRWWGITSTVVPQRLSLTLDTSTTPDTLRVSDALPGSAVYISLLTPESTLLMSDPVTADDQGNAIFQAEALGGDADSIWTQHGFLAGAYTAVSDAIAPSVPIKVSGPFYTKFPTLGRQSGALVIADDIITIFPGYPEFAGQTLLELGSAWLEGAAYGLSLTYGMDSPIISHSGVELASVVQPPVGWAPSVPGTGSSILAHTVDDDFNGGPRITRVNLIAHTRPSDSVPGNWYTNPETLLASNVAFVGEPITEIAASSVPAGQYIMAAPRQPNTLPAPAVTDGWWQTHIYDAWSSLIPADEVATVTEFSTTELHVYVTNAAGLPISNRRVGLSYFSPFNSTDIEDALAFNTTDVNGIAIFTAELFASSEVVRAHSSYGTLLGGTYAVWGQQSALLHRPGPAVGIPPGDDRDLVINPEGTLVTGMRPSVRLPSRRPRVGLWWGAYNYGSSMLKVTYHTANPIIRSGWAASGDYVTLLSKSLTASEQPEVYWMADTLAYESPAFPLRVDFASAIPAIDQPFPIGTSTGWYLPPATSHARYDSATPTSIVGNTTYIRVAADHQNWTTYNAMPTAVNFIIVGTTLAFGRSNVTWTGVP